MELLDALQTFKDATIIITRPNSDSGNAAIQEKLTQFSQQNAGNYLVTTSLGQKRYLSCMKLANAVVGNSSSGLIEAPLLMVPTVNIGDRQKGRESTPSVINAPPKSPAIIKAINLAISSEFKDKVKAITPQYDSDGRISERIRDRFKTVNLSQEVLKKTFHFYPN